MRGDELMVSCESFDDRLPMDNATYHALTDVVSKSHLDLVAKSPLHYWARYLDPDRVEPEPTAAMLLGTALHTHVLEPDTCQDRYVIAPEGIDRRTKAGKEAWAEFEAAAAGKTVLSKPDAEQIMRMGESVLTHPAASLLLDQLPGKAETTWMWTDAATELRCKCRPDWLTDDGSLIIDLKTTEDASPRGFERSVANYRYWVQAGFYVEGLHRATGKRPDQFIFICVEKKPPYAVAVYAAAAEMIEAGWKQAQLDLEVLATCKAANAWPGYSDQIETINLPPWMRPRPDGTTLTPPPEIETY